MTLSNKTKGATVVQSLHKSLLEVDADTYTVKLFEIINEIVENTNLTQTDAISAMSILSNSIKDNLAKGHNVNLGELGTFSTYVKSSGNTTVNFQPTSCVEREIGERAESNNARQLCQG